MLVKSEGIGTSSPASLWIEGHQPVVRFGIEGMSGLAGAALHSLPAGEGLGQLPLWREKIFACVELQPLSSACHVTLSRQEE